MEARFSRMAEMKWSLLAPLDTGLVHPVGERIGAGLDPEDFSPMELNGLRGIG